VAWLEDGGSQITDTASISPLLLLALIETYPSQNDDMKTKTSNALNIVTLCH
jgi:hypothetical protein